MAGNTVIGFVTMPDTLSALGGEMMDNGIANTSKNMVDATISGIKDRYQEDLVNGDARSRGEVAGDVVIAAADVALTAIGIGKVFRVGDAASDIAKVGKLADTFDDISDTARTIDKIEDITDGITDISKVEDATSVVSKVEKVNGLENGSKTISSINDLTQEQIAAIRRYTGDDYININNSLRGFEMATPENQATIDIIRETLGNASLPDDMTLYRGTSTKALGTLEGLNPDELVGRMIYEDAFMSTSTNSNVAQGTFSGNMQMTIEASKGANALDVASISQYHTESEILFNAGQSMLITSAEQRNGILYISVRIQ